MKKIWVVAMRGRNPANPTQRVKGQEFEQRLEINYSQLCNALTSVSKDTMVLEYDDGTTSGNKDGKK